MRFLLSAALVACICTPVLAKQHRHMAPKPANVAKWHEPLGPGCFTADRAMDAISQHDGATVARLDGNEAQILQDKINQIGTPTDYHAQTVIVVLYPDHAAVAFFNACHENDVAIGLKAFSEIWAEFRGVPV